MNMTFGEKIKNARTLKGLTQKQLAEKIGAKHNSISDWEKNKNKPDPDTIELLCGILEISPNYLLGNKLNNDISPSEKEMIKKYRSLNDSGKEMVNIVLDKEYERSKAQTTTYEESTESKIEDDNFEFDHLMPIAAHLDNPSDEQMALVQKDLERLLKIKNKM